MKFSSKDFFSKCDQICSFLRIWSHLLKKSLLKNFIFCAVKCCQGKSYTLKIWFDSLLTAICFAEIAINWFLVFLVYQDLWQFAVYLVFLSILNTCLAFHTAQKMKFFMKDFFSKCDRICVCEHKYFLVAL